MTGKHKVTISTKRLKYDFVLKRNLTILQGDSATGKTTLIEMVRDYVNNPSDSPVTLVCDKNCYVLEGILWEAQLNEMQDSIVFIDEGNEFVKTKDFAGKIKQTDNYYVIVTREALPALPYSIEEIYGIRVSNRYGTLKQKYNEFYHMYHVHGGATIIPDILITEDSNSGYQFFHAVSEEHHIICESAHGKSNIFSSVNTCKEQNILVIADGAAFGSEIDRILQLISMRDNIVLYLPESFEWLILSAGILKNSDVLKILNDPSEYIESRKYFSWERFFTALLVERTQGDYLAYNKKELNPAYLTDSVKNRILKSILPQV